MKLEINVPVSGLDLASLLEGEQGLFLSQNRGQNYHHGCDAWSSDRLWADANWSGDSGASANSHAGAVVRDKNQQLD